MGLEELVAAAAQPSAGPRRKRRARAGGPKLRGEGRDRDVEPPGAGAERGWALCAWGGAKTGSWRAGPGACPRCSGIGQKKEVPVPWFVWQNRRPITDAWGGVGRLAPDPGAGQEAIPRLA